MPRCSENAVVLTEISPANAYLLGSATIELRNAEDARSFAALDHTTAFVAGEAETATGYCWGYSLQRLGSSAMADVHELEVAERRWRRGIARRLMLAFLGAAQRRGATKVFLTTGSGQTSVVRPERVDERSTDTSAMPRRRIAKISISASRGSAAVLR